MLAGAEESVRRVVKRRNIFVQHVLAALQRPRKIDRRRSCGIQICTCLPHRFPKLLHARSREIPRRNIESVNRRHTDCRCAAHLQRMNRVPDLLLRLHFYVNLFSRQLRLVENQHFILCKLHRRKIKNFHIALVSFLFSHFFLRNLVCASTFLRKPRISPENLPAPRFRVFRKTLRVPIFVRSSLRCVHAIYAIAALLMPAIRKAH